MKSFQSQTHYEVLEISVGATGAEIRSAYERLTQLYSEDQVVLYGLIDANRAAALRVRLKEAFDVLTDDDRRDVYEVNIGLPPRDRPRKAVAKAVSVATGSTAGWGSSFSWVSPAQQAPAAQVGSYTYVVAPVSSVVEPPKPQPVSYQQDGRNGLYAGRLRLN